MRDNNYILLCDHDASPIQVAAAALPMYSNSRAAAAQPLVASWPVATTTQPTAARAAAAATTVVWVSKFGTEACSMASCSESHVLKMKAFVGGKAACVQPGTINQEQE